MPPNAWQRQVTRDAWRLLARRVLTQAALLGPLRDAAPCLRRPLFPLQVT